MSITLPEDFPELSTRRQLKEVTQISEQTFARWATEGKGPKFIKLGGSVRYPRSEVLAWLQSIPTS
ncbi:helix-turn-helix domain-containing protein [Microbacterium testaceum]|uniref:helix-turn-helix transcriptional regulator n=1 Tax=Microbacterium testaceum TaxID=2033 RepID=UPI003447030B